MAMIAISAGEAALDVGLLLYHLIAGPKTPLPPRRDMSYMAATNGAPIPFGYGLGRPEGNVIWTSGISYTQLGKKSNSGQALGPKGSSIFSASLAVSFGEGPGIINRIWGDSKLIYDANPALSNPVPASDWPAWSSTQLYNPGNQVNYQGMVWQCIETNINSAPSQANTNWLIVSTYPPWDNRTEYNAGDIVSFGGQLWLAQGATYNGSVGAKQPGNGDTFSAGQENVLYWIALTALYAAPTIYPGDEEQLPDSLIQASEGMELTPAYRGQIYAVWEGLILSNFANRIPSFRAEVNYTKVSGGQTSGSGAGITDAIVESGGIDYHEGDIVSVMGGNSNAILTITAVDSEGIVTGFEITAAGSGYKLGQYQTNGGGGSGGFSISVLAVG